MISLANLQHGSLTFTGNAVRFSCGVVAGSWGIAFLWPCERRWRVQGDTAGSPTTSHTRIMGFTLPWGLMLRPGNTGNPDVTNVETSSVGRKAPRAEQAHGEKMLQPLAIRNIGLSAWHVLKGPRVHQAHFQSTRLQDLEQRNPVNPAFDAAVLQTIRKPVQVLCKGRKTNVRLRISID